MSETATFSTTDSGDWAWSWTDAGGTIERQVIWSHQRGTWLSWQRVDGGAWTEQDLPDWPQPHDRDHAAQIVDAHLSQRGLW